MSTVPNNWSQLRVAERARLDDTLRELDVGAGLVSRVLDRKVPVLARAFQGSVDHLARAFVIGGRDVARDAVHLSKDALPRVLAHGDEPPHAAPASSIHVLSYVALLRCLDLAVPDTARDLESRWLTIVAARPDLVDESGVRTAALACVAAGQIDLTPRFAGGGGLAPRKTSRHVAGPNILGLARHLAEVIKGGGGYEAVEEPWSNFLKMFPLTLASDGCRWVDLVWAAIAMMVHFEKRPVSEVGIWLPQLVKDLE
jgi:hypothetical protein